MKRKCAVVVLGTVSALTHGGGPFNAEAGACVLLGDQFLPGC